MLVSFTPCGASQKERREYCDIPRRVWTFWQRSTTNKHISIADMPHWSPEFFEVRPWDILLGVFWWSKCKLAHHWDYRQKRPWNVLSLLVNRQIIPRNRNVYEMKQYILGIEHYKLDKLILFKLLQFPVQKPLKC